MKLRIKGNSIRLRLTQTEVKDLQTQNIIEQCVQFPNQSQLKYGINILTGDDGLTVDFAKNKLSVNIGSNRVNSWYSDEEISISGYVDNPGNEKLLILIEKDFKCLSPRDEDESDMFPHPKEKH